MIDVITVLSELERRSCWFAVTVRSRHEKVVARNLRNRGLEEFLPLYRARRSWSDRVKVVELPLFPTYVFCRFDPRERFQVLNTPNVTSIVSFNKTPAPLDEVAIASIQTIVQSGVAVLPLPSLRVGQPVRIESGALRGLQGTLVREKGSWRAVVNVELLRCSVSVEIDRDLLSAVKIGESAVLCDSLMGLR